ncbi:MAG: Sugar phosphate permease [Actinoallomurus sp.]|nr:Sugar phosphate permease [Actinoallomurus sp.]
MNLAVLTPRPPETGAHPLGGRRAWSVWGVGALVYLVAFFHRTSLGVAALAAQQRFGIGATALSMFAILQLGVYMVMQVPGGIMADRFGPRRMLGAALLCMALGELLFSFATSMPVAVLGRALVGLGDAFTFINVVRLAASWFPRGRFALLTALTAMTGALGQIAGTVPLAAALRVYGWTPTFLGAAVLSVVVAVVVWWWVRDHPEIDMERSTGTTSVLADLRAAYAQRGTRAGLWTHFTLMSPFMMLATLWGYPYLVKGLGMAPATAKLTLTLAAATPLAVAPAVGWVAGRRPALRGRLIVSMAAALTVAWILAITWPGGTPAPLAVTLILLSAAGSAVSMLAFDLARDANPPSRGGVASGIVNVGGFSAAMIASLSAGTLLDSTGGRYDGAGFQVAFIPITCLVIFGTIRAALLLRPRRARP